MAKPIMGLSTRHRPVMGFAALCPSYETAVNTARVHGMYPGMRIARSQRPIT